jgi:hypothetical protein
MRGLPIRLLRAAAVALGLAGLFAPAARAHHYRLEGATPPAPFQHDGRVDAVMEPSGVAPIGDGRRVLVADDKTAPLHVLDLATGALVGPPLGSPKFPPTTTTGPNWGGMALDSDGNYYLVGSHSGKSDEERAARSTVIRFRLRAASSPPSTMRRSSAGASPAHSRPRCARRGSTRRGSGNGRSRGWLSARVGAVESWSSASASRTTRSAPSPPTSRPGPRPTPNSSSAPCSRSTPVPARARPRSSPRWSTSP